MIQLPSVRLLLRPALLAVLACTPVPEPDGQAQAEVTLHGVRLRSYRGSTLSAVGHADEVRYYRASADVVADRGEMDVFRLEAPRAPGTPPPVTRIRARQFEGNLLTQGIDARGAVEVRTPTGLVATTEGAHLDSPTMHVQGNLPVRATGPNGFSLTAAGFEAWLRDDTFEFDRPSTRVSGP